MQGVWKSKHEKNVLHWGHTWPGEGTENIRGRGRVRMWEMGEKEKRKVIFSYSFSESPKNAMPLFFYFTPQKGKALFQTVDSKKNYLG